MFYCQTDNAPSLTIYFLNDFFLKCPFTKYDFSGRWSLALLLGKLGKCFANKATVYVCEYSTGTIIPVTRCPDRKTGLPGPHVATWFPGFSIRFIWSPVLVGYHRVITPVEGGWLPHQADPNLSPRWDFLPRERQDELVFPLTGDLYQGCSHSSHPSTVLLSLVPSHGSAACQVAKAVELLPSPATVSS